MLVYFFFSFANLNFYPFIYYQIYHSSDMKHLNAFLSIFFGLILLVQPESVFSQSAAETIRWDSSLCLPDTGGKPHPGLAGAFSGCIGDFLFIAGGIGLAPLRSVINYVLDNRDDYGTVDIVYGSRSADDLVQLKEIQEVWMNAPDVHVHLTIDREQEGWDGHVGFVPNYVKELGFDVNKTALICGPPIMIKFTLAGLEELGFSREQVYTTLELRMKCGIGKCGRCNIGSKYVCKDGPVFRCDEIDEMPNEY